MTVEKEGKTGVVGKGGVTTPVGGGLPWIKPWCMEAQTPKPALWASQILLLLVDHTFPHAYPGVSVACRILDCGIDPIQKQFFQVGFHLD